MTEYTQNLINCLAGYANEENAAPMAAYMKHHFVFYGIKSPARKEILKAFYKANGLPTTEEAMNKIIRELWAQPQRELHYAAIDIVERSKKQWSEDTIILIEELLVKQSWWDSVDTIAAHLVGDYFLKYPEKKEEITEKWIISENKWLRRTAIIFQLSYKKATDTRLLADYICICMHEKEFFIAKAIGWALRQYARTNAAWVQDFVARHDLQPLSQREALKHLV
jgi:3-methyladenine DNA glycosylase AlkD